MGFCHWEIVAAYALLQVRWGVVASFFLVGVRAVCVTFLEILVLLGADGVLK